MTGATILGAFFQSPAISYFAHSEAEHKAREARLGSERNEGERSIWKFHGDVEINDLAEIQSLLTNVHESWHFLQTLSTSYGLLDWRIRCCIVDDINWLMKVVAEAPEPLQPTVPLLTWLNQGGTVKLLHAHPPDQFPQRNLSLSQTIEGLNVLVRFLSMLVGAGTASMRSFVETANQAMRYLALRCDLPSVPTWTSRHLGSASYLPPSGLTVHEVLEGTARFRELSMLDSARASESVRTQWFGAGLHGHYERVCRLLLDEIGDRQAGQFIGDLALMGRADPALSADGSVVQVEDVLPSWRFERLVDAARSIYWYPGVEGVTATLRELPKLAGLPEDTWLDRADDIVFNGKNGWFSDGGVAIEGRAARDTHRDLCLRRFRHAFTLRAADPMSHSISGGRGPIVASPVISFYADKAIARRSQDQLSSAVVYSCWADMVVHSCALALTSDGDISFLRRLEPHALTLFGGSQVENEATIDALLGTVMPAALALLSK